jgi:hypothetical protein
VSTDLITPCLTDYRTNEELILPGGGGAEEEVVSLTMEGAEGKQRGAGRLL